MHYSEIRTLCYLGSILSADPHRLVIADISTRKLNLKCFQQFQHQYCSHLDPYFLITDAGLERIREAQRIRHQARHDMVVALVSFALGVLSALLTQYLQSLLH